MAVWQWSKTATNNATSDASMNWSEGIPPSIINDNVRAEMARIAEWRDDISGSLTTGGIATAYTLTTNEVINTPTPTTGQMVAFVPNLTNGVAPTLAVDGGSAYPIQQSPGVAVATGFMLVGSPYTAMFNGTAWVLRDVPGVFGAATFGGAATFNSTATFNGSTVVQSTDAGAGVGPVLDLFRDSASPAVSDGLSVVDFNGRDSAANKQLYGRIGTLIASPTSTTEGGIFYVQIVVAGVLTTILLSSGADMAIPGNLAVTGNATSAGALSGATAAGAMLATQAEQETGTATDKLVTPGRQQYHPGMAKAWVKFAGSNGAISVSYNVASVTRNSTGNYTITLTTAFSSANYVVQGTARRSAAGNTDAIVMVFGTPSASAFIILTEDATATLADPLDVYVVCFGDQ